MEKTKIECSRNWRSGVFGTNTIADDCRSQCSGVSVFCPRFHRGTAEMDVPIFVAVSVFAKVYEV